MRRVLLAQLIAAVGILIAGCTVSQDIHLLADASGDGELVIDLQPMFVDYYQDLLMSFGGSSDLPVFDLDAIDGGFAARPGIELVVAESESPNRLRLGFRFDSVEAAFEKAAASATAAGGGAGVSSQGSETGCDDSPNDASGDFLSLVSFESDGPLRTLTVTLDRSVVKFALGLVQVAEVESISLLLPPEGSSMTAEEYADYVAWALEEYAGDADAFEVILDSSIRLTVGVEGRVVSVSGGTVLTSRERATLTRRWQSSETVGRIDSAVHFEISVVELLTLNEPRVYSVRFRP